MTRQAFFDASRPLFGGKLSESQVQGLEIILAATDGLPVSHRAYLLATAKHETANTMQPVREALAKTDAGAVAALEKAWKAGKLPWVVQPYWRRDKDGLSWFGRGYVQLTHKANYQKASDIMGIDLVSDPSAALSPMIAARVLVQGSSEGWFRGKKLSDYLPGDYVNARRVINGTDKAKEIAAIAEAFERALIAGGFDVLPPPIIPDAAPITAKQVDDRIAPKTDVKQNALVWLIKTIIAGLALLFKRK